MKLLTKHKMLLRLLFIPPIIGLVLLGTYYLLPSKDAAQFVLTFTLIMLGLTFVPGLAGVMVARYKFLSNYTEEQISEFDMIELFRGRIHLVLRRFTRVIIYSIMGAAVLWWKFDSVFGGLFCLLVAITFSMIVFFKSKNLEYEAMSDFMAGRPEGA